MNTFDLQITIKAIDQASKVFKSVGKNVGKIGKSAGDVGRHFGNMTREAGQLATRLGILGGAAIWGFKTQFVDTAAQFEKFRTVLETIEGSSLKAKESMDWISDFAAKTPYELSEVTDSFVKLKAYGMEPTNGLLRTLGDTASAMGKPVMQAVEAIADAVNGENERLKEFGIKARVEGNKIKYEYSYNGRQMVKEADKNSRSMIESTLSSIFNQKYAGAMDKQSRTWIGMMSNISDQWTRFTNMVMDAGVFDFLKNNLQDLLSRIDTLAKSGKLKVWADDLGKKIISGFKELSRIGKEVYPVLVDVLKTINALAQGVGGYGNVLRIIIALMSLKLVKSVFDFSMSIKDLAKDIIGLGKDTVSVISKMKNLAVVKKGLDAVEYRGGFWKAFQHQLLLTKYKSLEALGSAGKVWKSFSAGILTASRAMLTFTASLLTNPIFLTVAAVAALAGTAYLIYKNWKPISAFVKSLWGGIVGFMASVKDKMYTAGVNVINSLWQGMKSIANKPVEAIREITQKIRNHLPFSPAKVGPLRDIHRIRLVETIAENIKGEPLTKAVNRAVSPARQSLSFYAGIGNKNSGAGIGAVTIHYNPTINISTASQNAKEDFAKQLQQHSYEIQKMIRDIQSKNMRTAY